MKGSLRVTFDLKDPRSLYGAGVKGGRRLGVQRCVVEGSVPSRGNQCGNMRWKNHLYGQSRAGGKGSSNSRLPGLV